MSENEGKVNVYAVRTHFMNDRLRNLYKQLQDDLGKNNVFMIIDVTRGTPDMTGIDNYFTIDEEWSNNVHSFHSQGHLSGLNYRGETTIYKLYEEISKIKKFDYLWQIEYDVHCKGSFAKALSPCHEIECDYLAKGGDDRIEIRRYIDCPWWCWWGNLFGELASIPMEMRQGCFYPVTRYSIPMLEAIKYQLNRSSGFTEMFFPAVCTYHGLSYKTIPAECIGLVQFSPNIDPVWFENHAEQNKLYHPIKINQF